MNIRGASKIVLCFILICVVFLPAARADDWDQMTKFTFNQPVEIPGGVLPAGTYWFVLQNNHSDRNIVLVFSTDWSKLDAILMTVPIERRQSTNDTQIEFAERPYEKPEALLKWYYPDRLTGHEFLYSLRNEREFAHDGKQDVLAEPLASRAVAARQ
ncbi:MAG: hypothetical protein WBQ10_21600 [Terriglobales bacterium]